MLGDGGFGQGDFPGQDIEGGDAVVEEVVEDGDSCGMG